jgi:drug/metabolite transporter (DMT)-like permease
LIAPLLPEICLQTVLSKRSSISLYRAHDERCREAFAERISSQQSVLVTFQSAVGAKSVSKFVATISNPVRPEVSKDERRANRFGSVGKRIGVVCRMLARRLLSSCPGKCRCPRVRGRRPAKASDETNTIRGPLRGNRVLEAAHVMTIPAQSTFALRRRATLCGVLAILLWSSLALMAVLTADLPPFEVLAISFAVGGIGGVLALGLRGGGRIALLRQPLPAFVLAVVALFGYHALYFVALRRAPAIEVSLINYLWPLLIVVFAAFLPGVRLRAGQIVGTVLGLSGVVLVVTRGQGIVLSETHIFGYLMALGAALTWAAYSVLNRRFHAVPSAAISGTCVVVAFIAVLVHVAFEVTVVPTPMQWAMLVLMGIGPVGAAFWLWDYGTKHGDIATLGTLSYAAPLLSTLLLLLSGRGEPHWSQAVAVILLLIGAWCSVRGSKARSLDQASS